MLLDMFLCFYQDLMYIFIIFCQTTDHLLLGQRPQTKDAFTYLKLLFGNLNGTIFFTCWAFLLKITSSSVIMVKKTFFFLLEQKTSLQTLHVNSTKSQLNLFS